MIALKEKRKLVTIDNTKKKKKTVGKNNMGMNVREIYHEKKYKWDQNLLITNFGNNC